AEQAGLEIDVPTGAVGELCLGQDERERREFAAGTDGLGETALGVDGPSARPYDRSEGPLELLRQEARDAVDCGGQLADETKLDLFAGRKSIPCGQRSRGVGVVECGSASR